VIERALEQLRDLDCLALLDVAAVQADSRDELFLTAHSRLHR